MPPIFSRRPVRISITVSQAVHEALLERSDAQGRSLSNLAAYLLESALLECARPSPNGLTPGPRGGPSGGPPRDGGFGRP